MHSNNMAIQLTEFSVYVILGLYAITHYRTSERENHLKWLQIRSQKLSVLNSQRRRDMLSIVTLTLGIGCIY